jgi:hypothetical protein
MQKARRLIQAKRIYELTAGRTVLRKKLLKVAKGYPGCSGYFMRTEARIGKAILDDVADTREQFVRMT